MDQALSSSPASNETQHKESSFPRFQAWLPLTGFTLSNAPCQQSCRTRRKYDRAAEAALNLSRRRVGKRQCEGGRKTPCIRRGEFGPPQSQTGDLKFAGPISFFYAL